MNQELSRRLLALSSLAVSVTFSVATALAATEPEPAPAPAFVPVQASDVVYNLSASNLETHKYPTLQCQGTNWYFWEWGGSSGYYKSPQPNPLYGTDPSGQQFAAFSTVPSPDEPGKSAFKWELLATDPDTAGTGAKRCEFSLGWKEYSYPGKVLARRAGLPPNKDNWWGVAVRTEDWSSTAVSNDWQTLWQWHDAYGGGLPPFLTLLARGNTWTVQMAYDLSTTPTNSTLKKINLWSSPMPADTWARFVVKARKDLVMPTDSYVQVWLNGQQIVDYLGPFGYNVPQIDYAKVGVYHWLSTANTWNPSVLVRRMWSKGPVFVNDNDGMGYTWQSIDAALD